MTIRPRRSFLYMPGSNARALEKGRSLPADGLIFDLEDAVAPDAKVSGRQQIQASLAEGGYGNREILVRVNDLGTDWGYDDIVAAATFGADGILLPKVNSSARIRQVAELLSACGAPDSCKIWCMMETPYGILHAEEIASSPRIGGLVMGTSDLAKELHCLHTPERQPMMTSIGLCLLAARAFGIPILDGVHLDLQDDEGFEASCRQGRALGLDGKTLIHPKTIAKTNEVFAPSSEEIDWSRKIIAAHTEAEEQGKGIVLVDGKLIENLHIENARHLIALADAIRDREQEAFDNS